MIKVLFIPLDERPCNYSYPQEIVETRKDVQLIVPPMSLLGNKKIPADVDQIWQFVENNIAGCDALVASVEMLFYGGLLPSRLHHYEDEVKERLLQRFRNLKMQNPSCKFYAFQLIMRTPRYSSDDEEPDYYGKYGSEIFLRSYLLDKKRRVGINNEEQAKLDQYEVLIPREFILDYETRRHYNLTVNQRMLSLVEEGILEFLAIPQDDSCEFGYTAMDQAKVVGAIKGKRLQKKVMMYPGADEAGSSLVARAIADIEGTVTKVYPFYASYLGPQIIPLYEDRIMVESLKSHLMVQKCVIVERKEEADFILAINCPGKLMQESFDEVKDITYSSYRNLNWFCDTLKDDIEKGYKVVVADCAYANGGDLEFIQMMDDYQLLDHIYSYKAWNTHCNTLGTSIAQMVLCHHHQLDSLMIRRNVIKHLLEDGFYQAALRKEITNQLPKPLDYFNLHDQQPQIVEVEKKRLLEMYSQNIRHSFKKVSINAITLYHPWNRMFEVGLNVCVS